MGKTLLKTFALEIGTIWKGTLDIPDFELSLSKIKSYLKQKHYGQYRTLSSLSSKYDTPWLFKSFKFGNGSRMPDKHLVISGTNLDR